MPSPLEGNLVTFVPALDSGGCIVYFSTVSSPAFSVYSGENNGIRWLRGCSKDARCQFDKNPKKTAAVSSYLQCKCCRLDSRIFRGVASVTLNFIATPRLAVCFCFSRLHRHSNFQSFTLLPPAYYP